MHQSTPSRLRAMKVMPILAALALIYCPPTLPQALDARDLFQRSRDSVVLVMSFDEIGQPLGIGSGFFVDDGGKVVTNLHVVEGASSVQVRNAAGETQSIETALAVDEERDLIVLAAPLSGPPLRLSQSEPEIGENVIAIGNPQGLEGTLSVGIVSGVRNDGDTAYYQVTAAISPGSSGGPIIDETGEVLGVATFFVDAGQNLNFAMPATYIARMLRNPQPSALTTAVRPVPSPVVFPPPNVAPLPVPSEVFQKPGVCNDEDEIARQLCQAAIEETDPFLRAALWDEYNEYNKILRRN